MKSLLTIILLAVTLAVHAQEESEISRSLYQKFEKAYNAGDSKPIYDLFDENMKAALPHEKTQGVIDGLKAQVGNITDVEFSGYKGTASQYLVKFERGALNLFLNNNEAGEINGLLFRPIERPAKFERNTTPMILPFNEEWTVFWGGDTRAQNYHVDYPNQRGAFDIVIRDNKFKTFKTNGKTNEDYFVFGKDLIAPCDGEVIQVIDGVADNEPGQMNPQQVTGNTVVIKTANDEYLLFAHIKNGTVAVKEGQMVKQRDLLGQCGNSGNSTEPHLHFHVQDSEDFFTTVSAKCYFERIMVNGEIKEDYARAAGSDKECRLIPNLWY